MVEDCRELSLVWKNNVFLNVKNIVNSRPKGLSKYAVVYIKRSADFPFRNEWKGRVSHFLLDAILMATLLDLMETSRLEITYTLKNQHGVLWE